MLTEVLTLPLQESRVWLCLSLVAECCLLVPKDDIFMNHMRKSCFVAAGHWRAKSLIFGMSLGRDICHCMYQLDCLKNQHLTCAVDKNASTT